jgi:hypothetical protein
MNTTGMNQRKRGRSPLTAALKSGAAGVVIRSEGQRLAVNAGPTAIGAAIGMSAASVIEWRMGRKVPKMQARVMLRDAYGIPVSAWSKLPGNGDGDAVVNESGQPALPPPPADAPAPSTLENCLELLQQIRAARQQRDLMTADRVRLADTEAKILTLRHRLEKEAELLEDRLVREHPAWKRIQNELARVLARHPQAALEVAEALRRLGL